jgi:flagellar basal body-associated protein FliL
MTKNPAIKIYTVIIAVACGTAITVAIDSKAQVQQANKAAAAWQQEVAQWQQTSTQLVAQDKKLVLRYNALVKSGNAKAAPVVVSYVKPATSVVVASGPVTKTS